MYYLSKAVFELTLNIVEIRLLVMLSSDRKLSLDNMNVEQKKWVAGSNREYVKLKEYEYNLKLNKLITKDGFGLELKDKYIMYKDKTIFYICRNLRQLFVASLNKWHKGCNVIISEDMFYHLFGDNKRSCNKNWKRTCEQLNLDYSYEISKGKVIIRNNKPKSKKDTNKPYLPYKEYLQTEHWLTLSTKIKEDIGRCQLCDSTHRLEVHHNNYDNLWNETSKDLIVLCHDCHSKFHDKL